MSLRHGWLRVGFCVAGWLAFGGVGRAQETDQIPEPEAVELQCKDRLLLKATFYPGTRGKDTVPIIMLHGYKGNRNEFHDLAMFLQEEGHAVLVPDLRGHGESTGFAGAPGQRLDANTLKPAAMGLMVTQDLETCKRFLMERNNAGQLNIDKLCVIGSEMGAIVAMNWTALDWSWPVLPGPTGKQGQDVKALVLISPLWAERTLTVRNALTSPAIRNGVAIYILTGNNSKDAVKIQKTISKFRPVLNADAEKDLFLMKLPTTLSGTKLLAAPNLEVGERIAQFINMKLVEKTIPWRDRTSPLD